MTTRNDLQVTKPKDAGSCDGCRYAQPVVTASDVPIMECYRYPPQMLIWEGELFQVHPDAVYRCGEYQETNEVLVERFTERLRNFREKREQERTEARKLGDGHE